MISIASAVLIGILLFNETNASVVRRVRRQSDQNDEVIDNIFNIPITAIKQTAAAAQSFLPENTETIDNIFQIPVTTLEAVGSLVKSTSQRRQSEDAQRMRQEKRDRIQAHKEQQRLQRERIRNERFQRQQAKRIVRHHHKDPLGVNAFTNLLVGHHGILTGHHGIGGHGGHHGLTEIHGGHGSHGLLDHQNSYEVHENVEENGSFSWHGITAGFGSFVGNRPSSPTIKIQNKIAPKEKEWQKKNDYQAEHRIENKIAPDTGTRYRDDPPLRNKFVPGIDEVSFYR